MGPNAVNLTQLLFGFKGRIQRLYWWVATLAVGGVSGIVTVLLEVAARDSGKFALDPHTQQIEPTGVFGVAVLAVGLVNLWCNLALSVKRLHDRDRTGWWVVAQVLAVFLAAISVIVAIAMATGQMPIWYVVAVAACLVAMVLSVWLFVEIGFLRGTKGPNRYGPDPLGAADTDATL